MTTPLPYSAYKPSGIEWLGDVPEHWEVKKITHMFSIGSGTTPPTDHPEFYGGDVSWITTSELRESIVTSTQKTVTKEALRLFPALRIYPTDSVAVAMYGATIGRVGILGTPAAVNQACCVFSGSKGIEPWFWCYWLQSRRHVLVSMGYGGGQPNLSLELLRSIRVATPSLVEQVAIVRYLDHVDRRIRRFISAKQRLIALLKEERQAVINHAVTRGLDPNVRLKPSGFEWLGDVPEHWEVRRLRTVAEMRVSNVDKHTKEDEFPVRLCNYVDVYKNDRITPVMPFMAATASRNEIERFRLERDDVLITKDSEAWDDIGVPALVTEAADDLLSGYHLALLRPFKEILGAYLARTLQSKEVAYQFHIRANGVTRYGLTHTGIKSVCIPLPPLPEQQAIVEYLDKATTDIDAALALARRQIELVQEYRTRLISDVVTGNLDVREAAARLPDETAEEEPFNESDLTENADDSLYDAKTAEAVS